MRVARPPSRPHRTGLALLLVLGITVVVLGLLGAWLQAAHRARQEAGAWDEDQALSDLRRSGERLGLAWVGRWAGVVVAPPEGGGWLVADDLVPRLPGTCRLRLVAYDGWAFPSVAAVVRFPSLRRTMPLAFRSLVVPQADQGENGQATEIPSDLLERLDLPPGIRRWPAVPDRATISTDPVVPRDEAVLAGCLACNSDGRINWNTAPIPVLAEVARLRGRSLAPAVAEARRRGVVTPPMDDAGGPPGMPRLVAGSQVWNLQVTAWTGERHRSWWIVVTGAGPNWRILHRHAVDP